VKLTVMDDAELGEMESLSDAELGGLVRDGFKRLRAARDASGNVASSKEIELTDHTADDPPPTPGTPRPPARNGEAIQSAMDAAIPGYSRLGHGRDTRVVDEDRIVQSGRR
jgi:hypothetical protein